MRERVGPRGTWRNLQRDLPELGPMIAQTPKLAFGLLNKAMEGELEVKLGEGALRGLAHELHTERQARRRSQAGSALLIAGALLVGLAWHPAWAAWTVGAAGLVLLLWPSRR